MIRLVCAALAACALSEVRGDDDGDAEFPPGAGVVRGAMRIRRCTCSARCIFAGRISRGAGRGARRFGGDGGGLTEILISPESDAAIQSLTFRYGLAGAGAAAFSELFQRRGKCRIRARRSSAGVQPAMLEAFAGSQA